MKTLVIIPCYNEAAVIAEVIAAVREQAPGLDILVVNDGSTDGSGRLAARTGMAWVVDLPFNLGIGGAVQTGFKFAARKGYAAALQLDGDGQHLPAEIPKLLAPLEAGAADVVIGSRFCGGPAGFRSTGPRRMGIRIFAALNSTLIRQRISDNTSGFRAYNRRAIRFLAAHYPLDYPEPEAVILLGKNGFRLKEVAVHMQERPSGRSSIGRRHAVYYMLKVLLAVVVTAMRPKLIHPQSGQGDAQL